MILMRFSKEFSFKERIKKMIEQLKDIICEYVEVDRNVIMEDSRFVEDLGFTSYDFMSMVGELEEVFDIEVEEREAAEIVTVGQAVKYIEGLQD